MNNGVQEAPFADYFDNDGAPDSAHADARPQRTPPSTPVQIVERWLSEGPLVRVPTGIRPLDEACRGGLPFPWRVIVVGAPSAGKTFIAIVIARVLATGDVCVGILAVDEEPDDLTVRLAQTAGFSIEEAEGRESEVLDRMRVALAELHVRLYDATWTIDAAAADLATWAKSEGRQAALFLDSIQATRSAASLGAETPRTIVEANVAAMRVASTAHRMLVVATSEANRASYRSDVAIDQSNDLAAGAESRAIEFGAQTQLMARTPKGHPDVIHVRITKNRRAHVGEFWLRLDREAHNVAECDNPERDPRIASARAEGKLASNRANVESDALALMAIVRAEPSIGERELRAAIKEGGHGWGRDRLNAAKRIARAGIGGSRLVNRGDDSHADWHVEASRDPDRRVPDA